MLGANIKRARIRKGLTQAELAGEVGVTKVAIYYYETGMKTPSLATTALPELTARVRYLAYSKPYLVSTPAIGIRIMS